MLGFDIPKTPGGRASRLLRGLLEEARYGVKFLDTPLYRDLLDGREGERAYREVARRIRENPVLAATLAPLPLPPEWREAVLEGKKGDPRIPLFPEVMEAV